MTLKILRVTGPDNQQTEKIAEFHEGRMRGFPEFVADFDWLEGADEDEVMETFDGFHLFAAPLEDGEDASEEDQVGWFPDPDWEPEDPEYESEDGGGSGNASEATGDGSGGLDKEWTGPHDGPRGGTYWEHSETGDKRYQQEKPTEPPSSDEGSTEPDTTSQESFFHGTNADAAQNLVENGINPDLLQSRDRGFFGEGFYVAAEERTAQDYADSNSGEGDGIVEVSLESESEIADITNLFEGHSMIPEEPPEWQDDFLEWYEGVLEEAAVWEKIPGVERDDVVGGAREKMTPGSEDFEREKWYENVTRYFEESGYAGVKFADSEIVITDPDQVETIDYAGDDEAQKAESVNGDRAFVVVDPPEEDFDWMLDEEDVSVKMSKYVFKDWVPYEGPRNGTGWRNTTTEDIVYDDEKPEAEPNEPEDLDDASLDEAGVQQSWGMFSATADELQDGHQIEYDDGENEWELQVQEVVDGEIHAVDTETQREVSIPIGEDGEPATGSIRKPEPVFFGEGVAAAESSWLPEEGEPSGTELRAEALRTAASSDGVEDTSYLEGFAARASEQGADEEEVLEALEYGLEEHPTLHPGRAEEVYQNGQRLLDIEDDLTEEKLLKFVKEWDGPFEGERGGTYWEHTESGERRYQDSKPQESGGNGDAPSGGSSGVEGFEVESSEDWEKLEEGMTVEGVYSGDEFRGEIVSINESDVHGVMGTKVVTEEGEEIFPDPNSQATEELRVPGSGGGSEEGGEVSVEDVESWESMGDDEVRAVIDEVHDGEEQPNRREVYDIIGTPPLNDDLYEEHGIDPMGMASTTSDVALDYATVSEFEEALDSGELDREIREEYEAMGGDPSDLDNIPVEVAQAAREEVRNHVVFDLIWHHRTGRSDELFASKAASKAVDALARRMGTINPGGEGIAQKDSSAVSAEEYERADDFMLEMTKRLVWWDGDDLSKAPPAWASDDTVPEFVKEVIQNVIDGNVVWNKFTGYSRQTAEFIQDRLAEKLTQPQGWSIGSIVDDLQRMYSGMEDEQALNIARTEVSAIMNSAREEAYQERADYDNYVYYWQGPTDHRTTEVCKDIKAEVESRGGNVPLEELRSILRTTAKRYEGTAEGGTPERVSEWVPHYQCRHTFIRDVRATL